MKTSIQIYTHTLSQMLQQILAIPPALVPAIRSNRERKSFPPHLSSIAPAIPNKAIAIIVDMKNQLSECILMRCSSFSFDIPYQR